MGLCKCPKKKITNQFCFEHRVNVCENCMVEEHPTCVVQSYLKWLDDSDYNPVCRICDDKLGTAQCIRLVCYDVFHKECLHDWASRMAPNTAPAGYKCPNCAAPVFPAPNLVSPVADKLREMIAGYSWARTGLGLPLIEDAASEPSTAQSWSATNGSATYETVSETSETSTKPDPSPAPTPTPKPATYTHEPHPRTHVQANYQAPKESAPSSNVRVTAVADPPVTASQYRGDALDGGGGVARKAAPLETHLHLHTGPDADEQENKYKRRSAVEWFSRWWRTMSRPSSRHHQSILGGSRRMVALLVVLGVASILVVLSYLSHGASDNDPLLDPFNNPNIHVEGE